MLFGWLLTSLSLFALLLLTNIRGIQSRDTGCFQISSTTTTDADMTASATLPPDAPSIAFLSLCLFGFGTGFWLADVMGDSIAAEKAKLEPLHSRGSIQSTCYAYRFFGMMLAAPLSTFLYSRYSPYAVLSILAALPLCILPLVAILAEVHNVPVASTRDQCCEIWKTICSQAVWQPMGFVYLYNVMQVGNAAWQ